MQIQSGEWLPEAAAMYSRQSYGMQYAAGVRWRRRSARASPGRRALMRPGQVEISWPGWQAASIRSWW